MALALPSYNLSHLSLLFILTTFSCSVSVGKGRQCSKLGHLLLVPCHVYGGDLVKPDWLLWQQGGEGKPVVVVELLQILCKVSGTNMYIQYYQYTHECVYVG